MKFWKLIASAALLALADAAFPASVHVWDTVEIELQASKPPSNPVDDVEVWVDLQGPGFSKRVHGFWDGGKTFRVRVMANSTGAWTWRSGSQPEDSGLSGQTGRFQATGWSAEEKQANPNRRGQLRMGRGGRRFEYADGTPIFLLADTLWAINTTRCGLGSKQDGPFFRYLADRRAKGFNAVLMQMIHGYGDYPDAQAHRNEGGYALIDRDPNQLNPAYFQALDQRMRELSDQGFVAAAPVMWWAKTDKCRFTPQDARRIIKYVAARYGTFNSLWSLSGEYQFTFADCGWTPADINALGAELQRRNPWQHPVSIHPSSNTTRWQPPHNNQSSSAFHGEAWLDHQWLQTGQDLGNLFRIVQRLRQDRALQPPSPVFCSEASYERADDPESAYHARWQVWTALLNGAAGYGYGAHGVWQFLDPSDPAGEFGKTPRLRPVVWQEALRLPGSAQVGHARKLVETLGWPDLDPRRSMLQVNGEPNRDPAAKDLTPPEAARLGVGKWVIYLPRGNSGRRIVLNERFPGPATARWFDPRQGRFAGQPIAWNDSSGVLPGLPAPAEEDWVLVLEPEPR